MVSSVAAVSLVANSSRMCSSQRSLRNCCWGVSWLLFTWVIALPRSEDCARTIPEPADRTLQPSRLPSLKCSFLHGAFCLNTFRSTPCRNLVLPFPGSNSPAVKSLSLAEPMKPACLKAAGIALLAVLASSALLSAQTVTSFAGISASQLSNPRNDIDPNGAVGTKQYAEWTNVYFQAYDKATLKPIWPSPLVGTKPLTQNGLANCGSIGGDGVVL